MSIWNSKIFFFFSLIIFLILLIYNFSFLSFNHNLFIAFLLSFFYSSLFCISFLFWLDSLFQKISIKEKIAIILNFLIRKQFSVINIRDGQFEDNFLLLRKKPSHFFIRVDHKSIVLITNQHNQVVPLLTGNHYIDKRKTILYILKRGINLISLGPIPGDRVPLLSKPPIESLVEYHIRNKRINQTKAQTKDGRYLFPTFQIIYGFKNLNEFSDQNHLLSGLAEIFASFSFPIETNPKIEEMITQEFLKNWRMCIKELDAMEVNKIVETIPQFITDDILSSFNNNTLFRFLNINVLINQVITLN